MRDAYVQEQPADPPVESDSSIRVDPRLRGCIQCGTCGGVCPYGYLMDYTPTRMIAAMRAEVFDRVMESDTVWLCVACSACTTACPAQLPVTLALMARTKEEMILTGKVPIELQDALEKTQRYGNPLGESPRKRTDWTREVDPPIPVLGRELRETDMLWFVGDYASYHPRVHPASRAFARLLRALGIQFAVFGVDENSDGDSQRLAGERGLFEMLAEKNLRALGKYKFNQIVTTDPHAYNAIKNEYPGLGATYPVMHYTELLAQRLDQLKPMLQKPVDAVVTYHDPCYLGRANGVYDEPRRLLSAIPGVKLVEMAHFKKTSLCCGGGGGGMWLDGFTWEKARARLSEWRVHEAARGGADVLAVACPYEVSRFEDAVKTVPEASRLVIRDVSEMLVESLVSN